MARCEKPPIPQEINGELRVAIQHLREVGDHRQQAANFKFKILFWLVGLGVAVSLAVFGLLITVALAI